MSYRMTIPVRFQDVDAAGVLFFGRIFDYCHMAYEDWIASSGVDRAHYFSRADYLVPIVHAEADYRMVVRHGDRVTIGIDVMRLGRASFQLRYRVEGPAGDLRADAVTVHAFVERGTMKPIAIPEPLRGFFSGHLLAEEVADHPSK